MDPKAYVEFMEHVWNSIEDISDDHELRIMCLETMKYVCKVTGSSFKHEERMKEIKEECNTGDVPQYFSISLDWYTKIKSDHSTKHTFNQVEDAETNPVENSLPDTHS